MDIFISIPYILVLFLYFLLGVCEKSSTHKSQYIIASFILFIVFLGLRDKIGWDWKVYQALFEMSPTLLEYEELFKIAIVQQKEMGFLFYTSFIKSICNNYNFFVFISSFIDGLLIVSFLKRYSVNVSWGMAAFFVMSMVTEVDLMRNVKAILIFLYSVRFIYEKRFVMYSLFITLGMTFHVSAIIFYPLYFFLNKSISKRIILNLFIIGNLIFLCQISIAGVGVKVLSELLGNKYLLLYEAYSSHQFYSEARFLSIGFLERTMSFFLIYYYYEKLISYNIKNVLFVNSFYIYILCHLYFFDFLIILERAGIIFAFSYWILYPNVEVLIQKSNNKKIFYITVLIYSILKVILVTGNEHYLYNNMLL